MTFLGIRLLGPPELFVGNRPLAFPTQKTLALLSYLVVEGGMHGRESLMALLWPERPAEKARVTLRTTLARLRRALKPAGDYLISEGGRVGFDFGRPHDLDLARLAAAGRPDVTPAELAAILALDRGEFLVGFGLPDAPEFDNWAAVQREAVQRQLEAAYDRLSDRQLAGGDAAGAVATAAGWLARAPLSEAAYRRLMAAQALAGDRTAALTTFSHCQAMLAREFNLNPAHETVELAEQIGRELRRDEPAAGAMPGASALLEIPFVGRAAEHQQLVAAYREATGDGARAVAVIGAAGVGKTRLVSAFQEWVALEAPGSELWQGRAFEMGGRLPYQPVVKAMRLRLEQENAPEDLLDDVWLAELSQLMPELRARYPDLPQPLTGDAGFVRLRLFEAMAVLGETLAARHPAVLVLDDMQWADADTWDMVHYVAGHWAESGRPILLLLTIRQENFAAEGGLRERLNQLGRNAPLGRLLLDAFNGAAVQQLVSSLAGAAADLRTSRAFGEWLWAESRGLPFFIDALLQMLIGQGHLAGREGAGGYDFAAALRHVQSLGKAPLPPGVREVILARVEQLSPDGAGLLLAAAVLGRECSFERLRQVADLSEPAALAATEALLYSHLLAEDRAAQRPYTLAHDYIREVVYEASSEVRRRIFHRRALLALEGERAPAAECAYHALAAQLDEPAFRYSVAAGSEAFASYAAQEALGHFESARVVARRMQERGEGIDGALLGRLFQERGLALEVLQDDEAARVNYEEMRTNAVRRQDRTLELAALTGLVNLHGSYSAVFNPPRARELAQEALALARELGDRAAEAGVLTALTVTEFFSAGDSKLIMAYGQQALVLARELGLKELAGRTLNILCWPLVAQRQLEKAYEALAEAQAIWTELGDLPRLGEALRFLLIVHFAAGDQRRMLEDAPRLIEVGTQTGSRLDQLNTVVWLANVHSRQGRFGQALDYLEQAAELTAAIGYSNEEQGHMMGRIGLYLAAGALEEAERWADRLYAQRETIMPTFVQYYLTDVARVKIACGRLDEGRAIMDEMLASLPTEAPAANIITTMAVAYGELNLAEGRPEALFGGLEERARPFREAGFLHLFAEEHWLRGRAALALGRLDEARAAFLEAKAVAEKNDERAILWQILASLGDVEEACGNAAAAGDYRCQAREVIDYMAEHAGPDELRTAFLGQPDVVRVMAAS